MLSTAVRNRPRRSVPENGTKKAPKRLFGVFRRRSPPQIPCSGWVGVEGVEPPTSCASCTSRHFSGQPPFAKPQLTGHFCLPMETAVDHKTPFVRARIAHETRGLCDLRAALRLRAGAGLPAAETTSLTSGPSSVVLEERSKSNGGSFRPRSSCPGCSTALTPSSARSSLTRRWQFHTGRTCGSRSLPDADGHVRAVRRLWRD
jgi:hypothetical protein